jgi:hypothetical protein
MSSADDQFREGLALLSGRDVARRLNDAVALIEAAANAGHADAVARRAALECKGVAGAPDWHRALDSLADAAELGSASAAGQLIVLADDRFDAGPRKSDWRALRARIPLAKRLAAPPRGGRTLAYAPLVHAIPRMFSQAECDWLIAIGSNGLERAKVIGIASGVHQGRTNKTAVLDLARTDVVVEMIRTRIANELRAPLSCLEVPQVLHYEVGEEFVLHCDFLDPVSRRDEIARDGQRSATFLIYLNDDFEGGETSFPQLGICHRGRPGDALVFGSLRPGGAPDPRSQHAGLPPTRGEKWLFSQWVRDR